MPAGTSSPAHPGQPDHHGRSTCPTGPTRCSTRGPGWSAARRCCSSASRTCGASPTCSPARSADGATDWRFDAQPLIMPEPDRYPEEVWGCEDPRLTWLPELDEWAIAYTAYSRRGPLVSLAMSRDFTEVRRLGPVMPPDDKDAALFPRRIDGRWAMIHRPSPLRGFAHIWISVLARTSSTGATTSCCSRRATAHGGTRARSASGRRHSRPPRGGSSATTGSTRPRRAPSTASGSRCWTSRSRAGSCVAPTSGSWRRPRRTNGAAT